MLFMLLLVHLHLLLGLMVMHLSHVVALIRHTGLREIAPLQRHAAAIHLIQIQAQEDVWRNASRRQVTERDLGVGIQCML